MPKLSLILAAALVAHALVSTGMWNDFSVAFTNGGRSYDDKRMAYAFGEIPIEAIRKGLDARLPSETPVALSPAFQKDDFVRQRLTEGLYPRVVERRAAHVLDLANDGSAILMDGAPVAAVRANTPAPPGATTLAWPLFVAASASAVGYGLVTWLLFFRRRLRDPALLASAIVILASLALALLTSAATGLQVPLAPHTMGAIGLLGCAGGVAYCAVTRDAWPRGRRWRIRPETWLLAALLVVLLVRECVYPVTLWDGRSIWFFHAKRIFQMGMFAQSQLLHADTLWSHPDYPLLYPAWLAHFSGFSAVFNERLASLGIPVIVSALLAAVWILSRRLLGRWPGAAFALAVFLSVEPITVGGYADGILLLLLLIEFLAFASEEHRVLGWIAAAAAAMTKSEGVVLAPLLALFFARGPVPFACFLPAVAYRLWISSLGVNSMLKGTGWSTALAAAPARVAILVAALPAVLTSAGYTRVRGLLWEGIFGLAIALALWIAQRRAPRTAQIALAAGGVWTVFAFLSIALLPENPRWFAETALDRLLLYPAALFVAAALLLASAEVPRRADVSMGSRVRRDVAVHRRRQVGEQRHR